ncbi:MAG: T9SS type A sorting domain-containing protein [Bacteroidales bacterium]|nr:T9SS type A sorting domain-containing protein [Bacteroidales bacterium]
MKKAFLTILFMSMACSLLHAVDRHWIPDETAYSGNMSVIGIVQIDGIEQPSDMLEIGAFCGEEVRGSQFPQYISQLNRYIFFLTIHGDDPCEITFKLWDHNTGSLSNTTTVQTIQYSTNGTVGSVSSPFALNFVSDEITPHWIPDETLYSGNMSMVGIIQIDGVEQNSDRLEIGAFCGEEVRGSQFPQYIQGLDRYIFFLTIHGDDPCKITFKLWNHNTGSLSDATTMQTIQYTTNNTVGSVSTPFALNFTTSSITKYTFTGSGSWTDPSNWTAPDGTTPVSMPDLTNEDVVVDGKAFIPNGESVTVKSLTINSEKVLEINGGAILTVTGEISNNDDASSLVLNDGGQIFQNNENVKATFRKSIVNPSGWNGRQKDGWQLISSPVVGAAVEDFIPENGDYDLYIWDNDNVMEDEDETEIPWVNYKVHYDDEYYEDFFATCFAENTGYLASYENLNHADFKGELNVSTEFEIELNYSKYRSWNLFLLGNTFTFDIEWDDVEKTTSVSDGFVSLNPKTGVFEYHSTGTIKSGQGYVVNATKNTKPNPTLTYSKDAKGRGVMSKNIDVAVSNSKGSDNVILNFSGSADDGFPKLMNFNDGIATIFTVSDNKMYGIANYDENVREIPLCFDAKEIGTYTISMKLCGDFEYVHLIDRMTGEDTDMLLESEYRFNAMGNDDVNRFIVRLSGDNEIDDNENFAYQSGKQLYINENGAIQIIDMTGRVVINETLNGNSVDISNLRNAAYIVRLVSENGVKTQKIVVL